ncbi:hypothetical protein EJ110_NYTH37640 [Nymphaea thermarum]|nr:hypothetical protein EJ110_NYTH37640 [Nymphaea thermarum]
MWSDGRFYWGKKEIEAKGIVVAFVWMSSQERNVRPYVQLYSSLGWNSLVCHSNLLNLFFPDKAMSLALDILDELIKVVRIKPCPIVLAAFSGGTKACMYKLLQNEYQLVRDCICGQIYDSTPVDFTSDVGTKFALHPSILKMSSPPRLVSWAAKALSSSLDALFLTRHEAQRAEYWQTLYASVSMGPFLIFCSEDDDLASYHTILNFAKRLQDLGGDVKLVKWQTSTHVGHYKRFPMEYRNAVTELLVKSAFLYSQRNQQPPGGTSGNGLRSNEISKSVCNLHKAAVNSNQSFGRVAVGPSDHFFLPSSLEFLDAKGMGAEQDERRENLPPLSNPPSINPHGVLGKILFDVCVPKNIEGWDVKRMDLLPRHVFSSAHANANFNPLKCIRRSRL